MTVPLVPDFQWMMDNLAEGVMMLDADLVIQYTNPAASALIEIGRKAVGQPFDHVFQDRNFREMRQALFSVLREGHPFSKREAHVWAGNRELVIDYTVTPMQWNNQTPYLLVELHNMDRLVRIAKEEVLKANHQITRQLIRGVAHELKNPLGGIRGAAQLLARVLPAEEYRDYTRIIIEETDRLKQLADRMLGSRVIPCRCPTNIHECLERVKHLITAEAPAAVQLVRDYDPSLPEIKADPDQLIQVFLNISRNALQALLENPQHERIDCIMFSTRSQRQFTIGSMRHRLVLQIVIEDNGPGIPENLVDNIFYPMISGRPAGSGLGLSIAQEIVTQYGGLIECHSQPGSTKFTVYLPIAGAEA